MDQDNSGNRMRYAFVKMLGLIVRRLEQRSENESFEDDVLLEETVSRLTRELEVVAERRRKAMTVELVERIADEFKEYRYQRISFKELEERLEFHLWSVSREIPSNKHTLKLLTHAVPDDPADEGMDADVVDEEGRIQPIFISKRGGPLQSAKLQLARALGSHWKTYHNWRKEEHPLLGTPEKQNITHEKILKFVMQSLGFPGEVIGSTTKHIASAMAEFEKDLGEQEAELDVMGRGKIEMEYSEGDD